jgi:hypothetical protein
VETATADSVGDGAASGTQPNLQPIANGPAIHSVRPDSGVAGSSARHEYERRHTKRDAAIDAKWGRLAGVVKFLTDDPQSTVAWAQGANGEAKLANVLGTSLSDDAIALHDRKVPGTRGNIDHIVIAASGVWIIDAKAHIGKVERRDVGGWFSTDLRLYVAGRDRTKAVDGLAWQVAAVADALADPAIEPNPALCFTDADWGWFAKPFTIKGVWCCSPQALAEMVNAPGSLTPEEVVALAHRLGTALPANQAAPSR